MNGFIIHTLAREGGKGRSGGSGGAARESIRLPISTVFTVVARREKNGDSPTTYLGVYDRTYQISARSPGPPPGVMAEKPFACPLKL